MKQSIIDFFDVQNEEHLKAYRVLQVTGAWPVDFLPEDVVVPPTWHHLLTCKMVEAWLAMRLGVNSVYSDTGDANV